MKYLNLFENESSYETFKSSSDFVLPNVSFVEETSKVFYNPYVEQGITYNMVDLGLPSGTLWADRNVGASSPEDNGLYFQWGGTIGYTIEQKDHNEISSDFSNYWDTTNGGYTFNKYQYNKLTVLQAEDDAAVVNMGSNWRIPTTDEFNELINNTTIVFIGSDNREYDYPGDYAVDSGPSFIKGVRFTGSNNNSIFIPAETKSIYTIYGAELWTANLNSDPDWSTEAYKMYFGAGFAGPEISIRGDARDVAYAIRGICNK